MTTHRGASVCRRYAPAAMLVLVTACGVLSPEEQLLTRFFEASRLHDTTIVSKLSAVPFNPRIEGVVREFDVQDVTEEGDAKRVTVHASVQQLGGGTHDRSFVFTMQRTDARWIITAIAQR